MEKPLKKYKLIIIIILLITFSLTCINLLVKRNIKNKIISNSSLVDVNDLTFKGLELMDSDLEDNIIFLSGEYHGIVEAIDMHLYLLKYFVKEANVKYILFESGYTSAEFLNEYLKSGDINILKYIMDSLRGTMAHTKEYYELIQDIYEFNKSLPEDKKVQFVGIDIEHQPKVALKYIKSLVPNKEVGKEIKEFVSIIKTMRIGNYLEATKELTKLIKEDEPLIKEYFGDNFFKLSLAIRNLSISKGQMNREEYMINNFKEQYENLPEGKYFGQFGAYHIAKDGEFDINGYKPFAYYIYNEYERTKGKVITITSNYVDSKGYSEVSGKTLDLYKYAIPENFTDDKLNILYKLNKEESILVNKVLGEDKKVIDYYDYIILFNNFKQATKYDGN